jgi:hypothetical protein
LLDSSCRHNSAAQPSANPLGSRTKSFHQKFTGKISERRALRTLQQQLAEGKAHARTHTHAQRQLSITNTGARAKIHEKENFRLP